MPDLRYPGPESIHRYTLNNGITVLVYENFAAQSIVIEGLVRAGALAESREQAGLASFTADMLLRGTETYSFEAIYEEIESVGASLDFGGGRHITEFSGVGLAEDLDRILKLLVEALRRPTFPEAQIEQVRGEIMTSLHMRANNTRRMAGLAFRETLYADHPYGPSIEGYLETIPTITREQLRDYHSRYYGPQGMIITLVGAVKADQALAKVEAALGDWAPQQGTMPAVPPAKRPAGLTRTQVNMADKTQSDIMLGLPGPLRSAPDYLDASLANTVLGVFGMMGRLGKTVREEQGLAYYAYSQLRGGLGPAPWLVSTGVSPDKVDQAVNSILHEIERMRSEPVPLEELEDSKAYRTGSLPVSLETNDGLAGIITDIELYQLGLDYLQQLGDVINAITPERVQAAAQKYLSSDDLVIAVAGPDQEKQD